MACKTCRFRKIKCDGSRPVCQNCRVRSSQCTYAGERRRRACRDNIPKKQWLQASDALIVAQLGFERPLPLPATGIDGCLANEPSHHQETAGLSPPNTNSNASRDAHSDREATQDSPPHLPYQLPQGSEISFPKPFIDTILDGDDAECAKDRSPAIWIRSDDGDEYTGPSSGICTISDLALKWVRGHVPESDVLCDTVRDIRNGLFNHLRRPKCILPDQLLIPSGLPRLKPIPRARVGTYVEAYFSTVQTIFPILDYDLFHAQLEQFGADSDDSPQTWKALLNAVLASGCRAALSDETAEAFRESSIEAWGFFQNALSYQTSIVHGATNLLAVQAVAVMAVFAQGMSSPQRLEYTLSSLATRLAHSLALHRYPPPDWGLKEAEKQERNRVFWSIYCLDKTIGLRCGRPCVIHDDEISCPFPRGVQVTQTAGMTPRPMETNQNFDFFLYFTKLACICGKTARLLYSASALRSPSIQMLSTMNHLLRDLESWRQTIPSELQPGKPLGRILHSPGLSRTQIVTLHFTYYYVLCAIHRRLTPIFIEDDEALPESITSRTQAAQVQAARSMVLLTKHLDVESFSPGWLVFYYPLAALTTIFFHVVSHASDESTQKDIALMETIVGFFGRLEYITSGEAAFTKTAEFVRQARSVAGKNANGSRDRLSSRNPQGNTESRLSSSTNDVTMLEAMDNSSNGNSDDYQTSITHRNSQPGILDDISKNLSSRTTATDQEQSILNQANYGDWMAALASPSGEIPNEHWLGSWASVGQAAHWDV